MIRYRRASERGRFDHGWLQTSQTFSFARYHDPAHMGFRSLRVINEDVVQPARGFGTHPHHDMEIVTYVLDGALEHKDSMGNGSIIRPGEVQRMSAGTGVLHSEFNASETDTVHLLQIWMLPERRGIEPGYEQREFTEAELADRLRLVGSRDGRDGSVTIHQDVELYASRLGAGARLEHELRRGRHAWVQVARGRVRVNAEMLAAGDAAAASEEERLVLEGEEAAELLLFDLA